MRKMFCIRQVNVKQMKYKSYLLDVKRISAIFETTSQKMTLYFDISNRSFLPRKAPTFRGKNVIKQPGNLTEALEGHLLLIT